jgi:hypothetical protein
MPTNKTAKKTTTPEAEQNKLRRIEKRDLEKRRTQITRTASRELRIAFREADDAAKFATRTHKAYLKTAARIDRAAERELTTIERRIGILNGRLGL